MKTNRPPGNEHGNQEVLFFHLPSFFLNHIKITYLEIVAQKNPQML